MRSTPQFCEELEDAKTRMLPMDVAGVRENGDAMGSDARYEALESLFSQAHSIRMASVLVQISAIGA